MMQRKIGLYIQGRSQEFNMGVNLGRANEWKKGL